jgi:hypothetical protein
MKSSLIKFSYVIAFLKELFYPLIFFLTMPVYLWKVTSIPLAVRLPQFDKPWTIEPLACFS